MELQRRPREDGARTDQQPQKRRGRKTPGGSSLDGGLIDELRRFKRSRSWTGVHAPLRARLLRRNAAELSRTATERRVAAQVARWN